jgi:8-oxo-dGTP pyrophosphatase MutT (NUDIX family)
MIQEMRESTSALALISRQQNENRDWLAHWNRHWNGYHLVGGHKHDNETFRDCVIREVQEELHLQDELDFSVAPQPISRLQYTAWSKRAGEETAYRFELFEVALAQHVLSSHVFSESENRWLSENDIRLGQCPDGTPVSETMRRLLGNLIA